VPEYLPALNLIKMKKIIVNLRHIFVVSGRQVVKWTGNIIHPLKDIPVPDFNDQYDSTML